MQRLVNKLYLYISLSDLAWTAYRLGGRDGGFKLDEAKIRAKGKV